MYEASINLYLIQFDVNI